MKIYLRNFKIYKFDTAENVIERIALLHDVLPQYLVFHSYSSVCNEKILIGKKYPTMEMFRLAREIEIEILISSKNLDYMVDLIAGSNNGNAYIKYRDELPNYVKDSDNFDHNFIMFMLHELRDDKFAWNIIIIPMEKHDIGGRLDETSYKKWLTWFSKEKISLQNRVRETTTEMELLENIPGMECTSVEMTGKKYELLFSSDFETNDQVFEAISTTNFFPLISMREFYQIHAGVNIPESVLRGYQALDTTNSILMSYLSMKNSNDVHSAIFVRVLEGNVVSVEITSNLGDEYHTLRTVINNFLALFPEWVRPVETKIVVKSFNCEFFFPRLRLNKHVFGHLILLDEFFSRSLFLNESVNSSKKKDSIYLYFMHETRMLTCTLIEEKKRNVNIRLHQNIKDSYIKVCMFGLTSSDDISSFQTTLAKFMRIYVNKYNSVVSLYEKYVTGFDKKKVSSRERSVEFFLKDYAPEIFVAGYPKKCGNQPTIVDDAKKKMYEEAGRKVMVFPTEADALKFSIPQYNYYCDHPDHKFPGLLVNDTFSNKKQFPYLPCCYINDQSIVPGSRYRHYFLGEDLAAGEKVAQNIIKTNKVLDVNQFGTLPELLGRMLNVNDDQRLYFRQGSYPASDLFENNTFLHCVLSAVQDPNISHAKIDEFRNNLVDSKIKKKNISICRQEMYGLSAEAIIEKIESPDEYLDPRDFVGLLSFLFKCNIYIFGTDGNIIIPNFSKFYIYEHFYTGPTILIYENSGSESDNLKFPRCELIISTVDGQSVTTQFGANENISKFLMQMFRRMIQPQFIEKQPIYSGILAPINFVSGPPTQQYIDKHGKSRVFSFDYRGTKIMMGTCPIKPLDIWEKSNLKYEVFFPQKLTLVKDFIRDNNIVIVMDTPDKIIGILGGNSVYFHVSNSDEILLDESILTSDIHTYNFMSGFAEVLIEHFFWAFSIFMHKENFDLLIDNIDHYIAKFRQTCITIRPDKDKIFYANTDLKNKRTFEYNSLFFIQKRLVLFSEDMFVKLVFHLKRKIVTDLFGLKKYSLQKFPKIPFRIGLEDNSPSTKMISGFSNVQTYLAGGAKYESGKLNLVLMDNPYYFLFENNEYIAQKANSLEDAYVIGKVWADGDGNRAMFGYWPEVEIESNYNLIEFGSDEKYTKRIFDELFSVTIAVKEINTNVYFFALLPLSFMNFSEEKLLF